MRAAQSPPPAFSYSADAGIMHASSLVRTYRIWQGSNVFLLQGRLIFGPDAKSIFITLFLILAPVAVFCTFIARKLLDDFSHHLGVSIMVIVIVLTIFALTVLLLTSARDPGIIPRNAYPPEPDDSDIGDWINNGQSPRRRLPRTKDVIVNGRPVRTKYCDTCQLYRPPRCSHCSVCDNCVERFDHHCPWVGQCIGLVQQTQRKQLAVMSFLTGLPSEYETVHSQILSGYDIPILQDVFSRIMPTETISMPPFGTPASALATKGQSDHCLLPPRGASRQGGCHQDSSEVTCYYCKEPGHTKRTCRKLQNRQQRTTFAPVTSSNNDKRNYRFFYMFVFSATLLCLYVHAFCWVYIKRIMDSEEISIWRAMIKTPASIALIIYTFIAIWFVGGLTVFHTYLISTNQSTYENIRYRYDRQDNPYNRGILGNFKEVFCSSIPPSKNKFRSKVPKEPSAPSKRMGLGSVSPLMRNPAGFSGLGRPDYGEADNAEGEYKDGSNKYEGLIMDSELSDGSQDLGRNLPTEVGKVQDGSYVEHSDWERRSRRWDIGPEVGESNGIITSGRGGISTKAAV